MSLHPKTQSRRQNASREVGPFNYSGARLTCPSCSFEFLPLPVEPVFDLVVVAQLIPCTLGALKSRLKTSRDGKEFPPMYRTEGRCRRRIRVLTGTQIRRLRQLMFPRLAEALEGENE